MKSDSRPIGIFDSGIGGLTVAAAINELMPAERLIYFGDTAHLPYGEKTGKTIQGYSEKITRFLLNNDCKAIVIACNSASATAYPNVREIAPDDIPVINVIDPTVEYAAKKYKKGKIGVIGTKATVNSRSYAKRIQKNNPDLKVSMLATPLLVSMIEEGFFNNRISQAIINNYLEKSTLKGIQALILGCTHFPLIKPEVESYYTGKTEVIDSSTIVATSLQKELKKRGFSSKKLTGDHHFFVSEKTHSFEQSTRLFFGEKLKLEKKTLK
ncbi:glutamate racemase [Cryomorphaceae bacterium 1068]|nr:glutamate racemase [Cryomorphaceae bacterium 1068]